MINYEYMTAEECQDYLFDLQQLVQTKANTEHWLDEVENILDISLSGSYLDEYDNVIYPDYCYIEAQHVLNNTIAEIQKWNKGK